MRKLLIGSCLAVLMVMIAGPVRADDFSGFYVGGFAGGGFNTSHATTSTVYADTGYFFEPDIAQVASAGAQSLTPKSFSGGGEAGYNSQFKNVVIGAEVEFGSMRVNGAASSTLYYTDPGYTDYTLTVNQTMHTTWLFTARPRIGVVMNRWLLYGTGGVAVTNINYQSVFTDDYAPAQENGGVMARKTGWAAGAGVEYQVSQHVTLKGEYLHAGFGKVATTSTNLVAPDGYPYPENVFTHSADLRMNIVRFGLNLRF